MLLLLEAVAGKPLRAVSVKARPRGHAHSPDADTSRPLNDSPASALDPAPTPANSIQDLLQRSAEAD